MGCHCPECHNTAQYERSRIMRRALDSIGKDTPMKMYALKSARGAGYVAGYGIYGFALCTRLENARMFETLPTLLQFVSGRRAEGDAVQATCGKYVIIRTRQSGWIEDGVVS